MADSKPVQHLHPKETRRVLLIEANERHLEKLLNPSPPSMVGVSLGRSCNGGANHILESMMLVSQPG